MRKTLLVVCAFSIALSLGAYTTGDHGSLERAVQCNVLILGNNGSHASGVVINSTGIIVTAKHVALMADELEVEFANGTRADVYRTLIDEDDDCAVLYVHADTPEFAKMDFTFDIDVGDELYAVGNPLTPDMKSTVTFGRVAKLDYEFCGDAFVADLTGAPGMSGGAVYNEHNEVVGLVVGGWRGYRFAVIVPITEVIELMEQHSGI